MLKRASLLFSVIVVVIIATTSSAFALTGSNRVNVGSTFTPTFSYIGIDSSGDYYVSTTTASNSMNRVQKYNGSTHTLVWSTGYVDPAGWDLRVTGLAVDSTNNKVLVVSRGKVVTLDASTGAFLGSYGSGYFGTSGQGLAINTSNESIAVSTYGQWAHIDKFDSFGNHISTIDVIDYVPSRIADVNGVPTKLVVGTSRDVAVDSANNINILWNDGYVYRFTSSGSFINKVGGNITGYFSGYKTGPTGLTIDPNNGNLHIASREENRVSVYTSSGAFVQVYGRGVNPVSASLIECFSSCKIGSSGDSIGALYKAQDIVINSSGSIGVVLIGTRQKVQWFTNP